MKQKCKAIILKGRSCQREAILYGYCTVHFKTKPKKILKDKPLNNNYNIE